MLNKELAKIYGGTLSGGSSYFTNTFPVIDEYSTLTQEQVDLLNKRFEELYQTNLRESIFGPYHIDFKPKQYSQGLGDVWRLDIT